MTRHIGGSGYKNQVAKEITKWRAQAKLANAATPVRYLRRAGRTDPLGGPDSGISRAMKNGPRAARLINRAAGGK